MSLNPLLEALRAVEDEAGKQVAQIRVGREPDLSALADAYDALTGEES